MTVDERFLNYVSFGTNSDEFSEATPSTPSQLKLGAFLADELRALGLSSVRQDEKGYVYALLPATPGCERETAIGFIAHMDTSPAVSGDPVRPRRLLYQGGDIRLNETEAITEARFPFLARYQGQELIVTDGTTLLGGDDKAGIAEIVTAAEYLLAHPEIAHGPVAIGFTPDEEIGRGADFFDVPGFGAAYAYTVDGGTLGELEYENFNAAAASVAVKGINIHPGSGKNKMKNASLLAMEFARMMPPAETPAHTEGYEGFYHLCRMEGDESHAALHYIVRDHDRAKFEARKAFMKQLTAFLNGKYGEGTFTLTLTDSYYNMKEKLLAVPEVLRRAEEAYKAAGVTPKAVPIRGGTDGARLSFMGLPCPNLSTGGENGHSVHEFVSADAMRKMVDVIVNICRKDPV